MYFEKFLQISSQITELLKCAVINVRDLDSNLKFLKICTWLPNAANIKIMAIQGCRVFFQGGPKLERSLPKNLHTLRKSLNFENWVNGDVSKIRHHFRQ